MNKSIKIVLIVFFFGFFINPTVSLFAEDQLFGGSKDKESESDNKLKEATKEIKS